MTSSSTRMLALLRGINVGGKNKVPMEDLRSIATALGFTDVSTYIQSGNLVFSSTLGASECEAALEEAIAAKFTLKIPVIVRTREQWVRYAKGSPFGDAERERPNILHIAVSKSPLAKGATEALARFTAAGERVEALEDALWIDFNEGVGRSKLTPAVLDRAAGSPVTARNWNSVVKLAALLG